MEAINAHSNASLACRAPKTVLDFFKPNKSASPKAVNGVNEGFKPSKVKAEMSRHHLPKAEVKPEANGVTILLSDSDDGLPQAKRRKSSPQAASLKQEEEDVKLEGFEKIPLEAGIALA